MSAFQTSEIRHQVCSKRKGVKASNRLILSAQCADITSILVSTELWFEPTPIHIKTMLKMRLL